MSIAVFGQSSYYSAPYSQRRNAQTLASTDSSEVRKESASEVKQESASEVKESFPTHETPVESLAFLEALGYLSNERVMAFRRDIPEVLTWLESNQCHFISRILSRTPDKLIIRCMPGPVHERGSREFMTAIMFAVKRDHDDAYEHVVLTGSTEFEIPEHESKRRKQADEGCGPSALPYPTVILEIGASQSYRALQGDVGVWFSKGMNTQLVILINVEKRPGQTSRIIVEQWIKAKDTDKCSCVEPSPTKLESVDWTDGVDEEWSLLYDHLFVDKYPPGFPEHLRGPGKVCRLDMRYCVKIRKAIIEGAALEVAEEARQAAVAAAGGAAAGGAGAAA